MLTVDRDAGSPIDSDGAFHYFLGSVRAHFCGFGVMKNLWWITLLLALSVGCGNCGGNNVSGGDSGTMIVNPDPVAFSQVPIGESEDVVVFVINDDPEALTLFDITLEPRDGGSVDGLQLIDVPTVPVEIEGDGQIQFTLRYTPAEDQTAPRASLVIPSTDARFTRDEPKRVNVDALGNNPRIEVVPQSVRFPRLPPGDRETQSVKLRNVGSAPLQIFEEPAYSGGEDFRLTPPAGTTYPLQIEIWDADAAQGDPSAYELEMEVEYAPIGNGGDTGEILVISNDPSGVEQSGDRRFAKVIDVNANADAPCILVDGITRNFGQVPIGEASAEVVTVSNCGTQPLQISEIVLSENTPDREFEIDLAGWDANDDGALDNQVVLQPNQDEQFFLKYTPTAVGSDEGEVLIFSNDPIQEELALGLVGRGSEGICPIADAGAYIRGVNSTPRQSISAAPLQYVVLDGSASSDEDGRVVDYIWNVVEFPDGTAPPRLDCVTEDPGCMDDSKREFRLLTAGEYIVELTVRDNEGFENCGDPARVIIRAVPNEKILVELTWTNPEDPDEADEVGSDVDLHLVKMGPGRWFETPYDVYFRNPNNAAGAGANGIWAPESPSLDIDDRDGGGPENINMDDPANCEWYAVGVHYYRQLFGTAYATVRVYINANLVYEAINKPLASGGQFWDVARIHWDTGQVYDYNNVFDAAPASMSPDVIPAMEASGLCTSQNLYMVQ